MKRKEFKEELMEVLSKSIDNMNEEDKLVLIKSLLVEYEKNQNYNTENKGQQWNNEELEIILSAAPTKENCIKYARLFKRGYGSIEQIYRWASTSSKDIKEKGREDDSFVMQVKEEAKKVGWRA
jgi:predicted secreted protein